MRLYPRLARGWRKAPVSTAFSGGRTKSFSFLPIWATYVAQIGYPANIKYAIFLSILSIIKKQAVIQAFSGVIVAIWSVILQSWVVIQIVKKKINVICNKNK